ncbi:hypothetical protein SORBI_3002G263500 [Sorghum bicolor]|uniref:Uncharacterized protein n=1 Tax=Sorghum bicolor TaxID=4558 RepID=A0A1B6QDM0_SORBI|nr:hypothetical protein SORBI_3002G263500 [Sorghum bicolor]
MSSSVASASSSSPPTPPSPLPVSFGPGLERYDFTPSPSPSPPFSPHGGSSPLLRVVRSDSDWMLHYSTLSVNKIHQELMAPRRPTMALGSLERLLMLVCCCCSSSNN